MFKRFFKKKGRFETSPETSPTSEFNFAMEFARNVLELESKKEDRIIILDFMLDVVREDLKTDLLSTIFYSKEHFEKWILPPFPCNYYDELGNKYEFCPDDEKIKRVDLSKDCVLVLPWHRERMINSVKRIFLNGFKFHKENHLAYYFPYVDFCYAYNGNHSIASGIVYKNGYVEAKVCDVSKLFKHVYTDGKTWYNSHDKSKLTSVFDFRVGIIYELAKLKYRIEIGE